MMERDPETHGRVVGLDSRNSDRSGEAGNAATARAAGIHGSVLDNLSDGVMVIERGGAITVFNPAAGEILGLAPGDVEGKSFAELFVDREGFEELSELILDAVTDAGERERQVVTLSVGGEARSLSVATSYRRERRYDGGAEPVALIAVFGDISELRELRETELRMAKAVEAQHAELQTAYRQIGTVDGCGDGVPAAASGRANAETAA